MNDPFKPPLALLMKLGSAVVHAEEALNPRTTNALDLAAFNAILGDPEVKEWLAEMHARALLPVKR